MPRKGVGIYAFVETDQAGLDPQAINARIKQRKKDAQVDLVQPVPALPRRADGTVRDDVRLRRAAAELG